MRAIDRLNLVYLAVVFTLVAAFAGRIDDSPKLLLTFASLAVGVLVVAVISARLRESRTAGVLTVMWQVFLHSVLYSSVGKYATILYGGRYLDSDVNSFEHSIFGGYPNLALDRLVSPWLTELMMTSYFSLYLLMTLPPLWLIVTNRLRSAETYLFNLALAAYVCYLGFLAIPLMGPKYSLEGHFSAPHLSGYVMTRIQSRIMAEDPLGACFPSSHVAIAWTGLISIRRMVSRRVFAITLPVVILLTASIVYNRYHYVVDAISGLGIAAFVAFFSGRLARHTNASGEPSRRENPLGAGRGSYFRIVFIPLRTSAGDLQHCRQKPPYVDIKSGINSAGDQDAPNA